MDMMRQDRKDSLYHSMNMPESEGTQDEQLMHSIIQMQSSEYGQESYEGILNDQKSKLTIKEKMSIKRK